MKMTFKILLVGLLFGFSVKSAIPAGITLTEYPKVLIRPDQTIIIKWQESISATMKYGSSHGNYTKSISKSGIRELKFTPAEQGIKAGVYYCVIASGSLSSQEFTLIFACHIR